jgi:multidrug efflux pump
MAEMEKLAAQLPQGFGYEWTGQSREEKLAGSQALILYGFAILAVFLCLAALYESWSIPLAVILVVPLGVLGVLLATLLRGYANDVYFQVGLITIIGLSAKNAILIIEFAKDLQAQGKGVIESALAAAHLRFRPIIMTSMAFGLGVLPLAIASGAGSASQRAIGTGVLGGMLTGTALAVFFVPIFFVVCAATSRAASASASCTPTSWPRACPRARRRETRYEFEDPGAAGRRGPAGRAAR